jgi:imidazolonepropionase-like amidohydrolase
MTKSQFNPFWCVCILAALMMSGCVPAAPTPVQDRLIFVAHPTDNDEIFSVNLDGTGLTNLTNHPANDADPAWSPDGQLIAFQSDRNGKSAIYIMQTDGTQVQAIPDTGPLDSLAGWSPDGQYLLLTSYRDLDGEIYVVRPDGSQLTDLTQNPAEDAAPTWSPDGKRIAFSSNREEIDGKPVYQIYVMDLVSGAVKRLTQSTYGAYNPIWSPNGKQIAFGMSAPISFPEIKQHSSGIMSPKEYGGAETAYVMQADGSNPQPLTDNVTGWSVPQTWSPDGKQVIINYFTSLQGENYETLIKSPDGVKLSLLPEEAAAGSNQRWWSAPRPAEAVELPPPATPQTEAPALPLALINGTLIDGTGGAPVRDAVIVIENGRITAVGKRDQVSIPDNAQIVDVQGGVMLPGFFNAHVHASYYAATLSRWIQGGVTTVCDLGASGWSYPTRFTFRDAVLTHPQYTRLVAAGPMVTVPDGYPDVYWDGGGLLVTSADDARQRVTQLLEGGADIVKITLESGVLFHQTMPMLSPEETTAIVEVAHAHSTKVLAHVTVAANLEKAVDAHVDDIVHMIKDPLTPELAQRVVDANIYWTPTLEVWHLAPYGNVDGNLRLFVAAGGKVALGTDYAGANASFDLGMPMSEIGYMAAAGMTPMQIIVAATQNAAYVCNQEQNLGTLEVGKIADVLVVNGDPFQDLAALQKNPSRDS